MTKENHRIRIGVVYIAIGMYEAFWKEFYPTCECFFCPDARKGYEVFTDSDYLQSLRFRNVSWHPVENRGFIRNVSAKSEFICSIASVLKQKYDYIFYMNGNYKFVEPIGSDEVLPAAGNDFLTALSFDLYKNNPVDSLPYDRNPNCHAYMKPGTGKRYYQGGFYGGRSEEIIRLSEWCMKYIREDLNNKIIARWHDESYLNRYLTGYRPRILNETYGYGGPPDSSRTYKALLLDKKTYLGNRLNEFKQLSVDNSLSFLLDDQLQLRKIGMVRFVGGLGNQMFQYAFYLYLRKKTSHLMEVYMETGGYDLQVNKFRTEDCKIVSEELRRQIKQANNEQKQEIVEKQISRVQPITVPARAIALYKGYWQCARYAEENKSEIEKAFNFSEKKLNEKSRSWLTRIQATCSVSVHVRRGDYFSPLNKEIYGRICTMEYYAKAIRKMKEVVAQEPFFFLFTDDPQWVRRHFKYKNCILVEGNRGKDDWQDLALMSACRHHIIANSSFGWWGAWLGKNPEKRIIAPDWWYYGVPTPDLLPDSWIRIPVSKPDLIGWFSGHLMLGEIKGDSQMPYLEEMKQSLYYFYLHRIHKKRIYKKIAETKLDRVCANLNEIPTMSEFVSVSQGILYLYIQKYIAGNPEAIFGEIDAYLLANLDNMRTDFFKNELPAVAGYFVSRMASSAKETGRTRQKLVKSLERTMESIWESRTTLSNKDKERVLSVIRKIDEMQQEGDKYLLLYMYCLDGYDITNLFFSEGKMEHLLYGYKKDKGEEGGNDN